MNQPAPAPGTAELYEAFKMMVEQQESDNVRRRAMFLSWVDEMERHLGYGASGNPPRTAQKNKFWRDSGQPDLSNY